MVVLLLVVVAFLPSRLVPPFWVGALPYVRYVRAALALAAGILVTSTLEGHLRREPAERADLRRAGLVRLLVRLLMYALTAAAMLAALGVAIQNITFGGAALTVVIGLAGQTLFGNVLAGMVLVIWRPFEIGDEVTVVSWRLPFLAPSYPHEALLAGQRGRVRDVNLLHTICTAADGQVMLIPNAVLLHSTVRNHSHSRGCKVRVRSEAEAAIPPALLWERLQAMATKLQHDDPLMHGAVTVRLVDLTTALTSFAIEAWVESVHEQEDAVSHILLAVAAMLEDIRGEQPQKPPPTSPSAAPGR